VAGLFYPGDRDELEAAVEAYLAAATADGRALPKAVIVPHAGFVYSGPVAATAYALLALLRDRVRRVVLFGPAHRVAFRGLATSSADAFETPLGSVALDREGVERALALPQVKALDAAHRAEHSLEVQLPFLQRVLPDFRLVPLVVGDATPAEVAEVMEALWGGDETLIVVSSDLSHYLPYADARALDRETSRAIEALLPEEIGHDQACGRLPVQGLLLAARRHGLRARTLDLRSSGDTAGPRDAVVGYGAYALS
jgi:AmmeMemoRadiSam system protein B